MHDSNEYDVKFPFHFTGRQTDNMLMQLTFHKMGELPHQLSDNKIINKH
jgi:hypothetical protein